MNITNVYFPKYICMLLSVNDIEYNRNIISNQIGHEVIFDEDKIIEFLNNNHHVWYDDNHTPIKIISNLTFKNNLIISNMLMNYIEYTYDTKMSKNDINFSFGDIVDYTALSFNVLIY